MGEMGSATCIICGRELPMSELEPTFTGRMRYRCFDCIADGDKQAKARIDASFSHGYAKKLKERKEWK